MQTRASAVLVGPGAPPRPGVTYVRVENPNLAFAHISKLFWPPPVHPPGVDPRAFVDPQSFVDPRATVMGNVTVARGAQIFAGAVLFPGVYVGENSRIGQNTLLYPNVVVRENCVVGDRVIIHANSVIGADGFGFAFDSSAAEHVKVPQVGRVRIEDDVEIGACTCIDRATLGETVIGRGTKIDNLVQIAHNVQVGALSLLCSQVGVSGSTTLGTGVVLAGQVGVAGHLQIGDGVKVGAQSGIAQDVPAGAMVSGSPAIPHLQWLKNAAVYRKLAELVKEVRQLRIRLERKG